MKITTAVFLDKIFDKWMTKFLDVLSTIMILEHSPIIKYWKE